MRMIFIGQQLWEIQEGRFGSPVPSDVVSILAAKLGISTNLHEFENIVQLHNVSNKRSYVVTCTLHNAHSVSLFEWDVKFFSDMA